MAQLQTIKTAFVRGARLMGSLRMYLVWGYLTSLVIALGLALGIRETLKHDLGNSAMAETMLAGFDDRWFQGFERRAEGLAQTFQESVVGWGPVIHAADAWLTGTLLRLHPSIVWAGLIYLCATVVWQYGVLGKIARPRESFVHHVHRLAPVFSALTVVAIAGDVLIFKLIEHAINLLFRSVRSNTVDERVLAGIVVFKYLAIWSTIGVWSMFVDYAKIIYVQTGFESGIKQPLQQGFVCLRQSVRFVRRHFASVGSVSMGLLAINVAVFVGYRVVGPGSGDANTVEILAAFVVMQLYIVAKVSLRLWAYSTKMSLAQLLGQGLAEPG